MRTNKNYEIKTNGITLIALVVTIVVLLILAGVSITMITGDNGIINRAGEAKERSDEVQISERVQQAYLLAERKAKFDVTREQLETELDKEFGHGKYTLSDNLTKVIIDGKSYGFDGTVIDETKDKNGIKIAKTTETTPFLPNPSQNEITNNDLSTGLTIKDEKQNEWVWIVVPKTAEVYKTAGVGQTLPAVPDNSENSIYGKIEADLRSYCETDKDGNALITQTTSRSGSSTTTTAGFVDEYAEGKGTNITSEGIYKEYKQKMLKSVYENGGFYIGKYEAGTETPRGNKDDSLTTAVVKQNVYPYNYVTNAQAEDLSERLKTGDKTTTLLFGVQWDLVLRHLSELGVSTSDLTSDSSTWGNYYNQQFRINRGEYSQASPWSTFISYTTATANKVSVTGTGDNLVSQKIGTTGSNKILLTTGASDTNCKKNIYDLAGNVHEWTLEKTSYKPYPCSLRGGEFYGNKGSECTASDRGYWPTVDTLCTARIQNSAILSSFKT